METTKLSENAAEENSKNPLDVLLDAALVSQPAPPECLEGAQLILSALGDATSILVSVGNYCRIHSTTFSEYHSRLMENRTRFEETKPELELDEQTRNVYGSIATLYQSLEEAEQTLLQITSLYDSSGFSLDLFQIPVETNFKDAYDILPRDTSHQGRIDTLQRTLSPDKKWDKFRIKRLVDALQSLGLVSWSSREQETFLINPQVDSWIQHTVSLTEYTGFLHMAEVILASHANTRDIQLHPELVNHINKTRQNVIPLHPNDATAFANVLYRKQFYTEELEVRKSAHAECLSRVGPEHWSTIYTSFYLAECSFRNSFDQENGPIDSRVAEYATRDQHIAKMTQDIRALESKIGKDHSKTLDCSYCLAEALSDQGRYDTAETCLRVALEVEEKARGQESYRYLTLSATLANVLHRQRKHKEAMVIYRKTLPMMRQHIGDKALVTLQASIECANTLSFQEKYKEAIALSEESVNSLIEAFGRDDWITIIAARALARYLVAQNRWKEAEEVLKWMLEAAEREFGHDCSEAVEGRKLKEAITRHYEKEASKTPQKRMLAIWTFTESTVKVWSSRRRYLYFVFQ